MAEQEPLKATKATFTRLYTTQIRHIGTKTMNNTNYSLTTSTPPSSPQRETTKQKLSSSGEIVFGHSQNFNSSPTYEELDGYKSGMKKSIPIRVVTYSKQGVPLPRTSSGQSHRGTCRNGSGGFYSA